MVEEDRICFRYPFGRWATLSQIEYGMWKVAGGLNWKGDRSKVAFSFFSIIRYILDELHKDDLSLVIT